MSEPRKYEIAFTTEATRTVVASSYDYHELEDAYVFYHEGNRVCSVQRHHVVTITDKTPAPIVTYVNVLADPDSIALLKNGIETALTAAFGDIITAEQLAVFNETFAATIGMEPEVPDADTV